MKRSIPANEALDSANARWRPGAWERCSWSTCSEPPSKRYDMPLCDPHATMITDRVNHIRGRLSGHIDQSKEAAEAEHLRREVRQLRSQLRDKEREAQRNGRRAATEQPKQGTIYYLQVGPHIKLGWTADLDARMRKYPPNSQLLAAHPGTRKDEAKLHKRFAVWRSHGREWYPLAPVLLDHIKRVVRDHGEPEPVAFGAQPAEVPRPKPAVVTYPRGWTGKKKPA